ncbi:LANO_0E15368g1_1 [Lachancea nothofagi CBS 11611]|uniref:LANO_0E15368g1_1 n=1 Tax=Lachancea nothofagi CBS 11611 TaxID=1266666 RepID=A0A1G4K0Z3_9SACH|nr:LANO_0E15368g1_1 [Lachancea nothofagi CBS 11611]
MAFKVDKKSIDTHQEFKAKTTLFCTSRRVASSFTMKILIPLDKTLAGDAQKLLESHLDRKFVVFDEDLRIFFQLEQHDFLESIQIYINEACVYKCDKSEDCIDKHESGLLELRKSVLRDYIFRSNIVMNNGHKNTWQIKAVTTLRKPPEWGQENGNDVAEDEELYLPSFEPLGAVLSSKTSLEKPEQPEISTVEVKYPIHTLLNVRLRNVAVPAKRCIYSSLDLQTAQSCHNLISEYKLSNFKISIDEIDYRLIRNYSSAPVHPVRPISAALELGLWDSYSVNYQLPQTKNLESHRVVVSLRYTVHAAPYAFVIKTNWETDVTLRKQNTMMGLPSQPTSVLSTTPMLTPSMKFASSMTSLVTPSKLNNVKFEFLVSQLTCQKGVKFSLPLQIVNHSQAPLDIVVYCTNSALEPQGQFPVEKEYMLHKRWMKNTEAIILLSNDHRLPTIPVSETFCADLEFFAILSGYYQGIPGLRILDLNSQEITNIGAGVKILIE